VTHDPNLPNKTSENAPIEEQPTISTEFAVPRDWTFDPRRPVRSIDWLTDQWNLEIRWDGRVVRKGAPLMAECPEAVCDYLDSEPLTIDELNEEIMLACNAAGVKISPRIIRAATDKIIRRIRKQRKKRLYQRLTKPMPNKDIAAIERIFDQLADLFIMPPMLAKACIAHWIWLVKQKMLGRPPEHHIMLIIFSPEQGSGKTTFTRRLVGPLEEFASADVLLSDFADHRSADIYRYAVVVIDDIEAAASSLPIIKSLITAASINRRKLSTSRSVTMRQAATLIGTSNRPIHELFDDDSGHRRFVMLPFKNGNVAKGGDARIWEIVNTIDFQSLWLAVDAFAPSPIQNFLKELHDYQNSFRPMPKVHKWVTNLNMQSEELRRITVRNGVRAEGLRDLYVAQTGDQISNQKFSDEMLTCTSLEHMPFSGKHRKEVGAVYTLRPNFGEPNEKLLFSSVIRGSASPKHGEDLEVVSEDCKVATPPDPSGPSGLTVCNTEAPDVSTGELESAEMED
jgi:hypothetical protein